MDTCAKEAGGRVNIQSLSLRWGKRGVQPDREAAEGYKLELGLGPEPEAAGRRRVGLAGGRIAGFGKPGVEPVVVADAD